MTAVIATQGHMSKSKKEDTTVKRNGLTVIQSSMGVLNLYVWLDLICRLKLNIENDTEFFFLASRQILCCYR